MNSEFEDLLVENTGPIVTITINRPHVRNACRFKTTIELRDTIRQFQGHQSLRAIILTGSGDRAFSAGADLKELRTRDPSQRDHELAVGFGEALRALESSRVPVIAAVRGFAVGGGTEIAMACHLRVAGRSARFGQPEILRGHIPGAGGTVRLPRLIGESRALQYLLTGDEIPVETAERLGLVNWVVADDEVIPFAQELATRIAGLSRLAVQLTLQAVRAGRDMPIEQALAFERVLCSRMRHDDDYREGLEAFVDKRAPKYNTGKSKA